MARNVGGTVVKLAILSLLVGLVLSLLDVSPRRALEGLGGFAKDIVELIAGFFPAWRGGDGPDAAGGRSCMAYASLLSGICLAQTGLGSVHGLASPLGAHFPIPHGVCCGTLVAEATAVNVGALARREPDSPALAKYARVAGLVADGGGTDGLVATLRAWTEELRLPGLGEFGMTADDVARVVAGSRGSSMKTNPIVLTDDEIAEVVTRRL